MCREGYMKNFKLPSKERVAEYVLAFAMGTGLAALLYYLNGGF